MVSPVQNIRHYQIRKELGRGKGATVYHAYDTRLNRDVALKICDSRFYEQDRIQQIEQERHVLSWLNVDGAPDFYDFFKDDTYYCLVMEYITGKNLEMVLKQAEQPIAEATAIEWGIRLCDVLHVLHNHTPPHIYRYIKPKNLIVSDDKNIYLIDYGKVIPYMPDDAYPQTGTVGYAPPEQYIGQPEPRSDIYSLGVLLYHAVTLYDPRARNRAFLFHVRPPRSFNEDVSITLEEVILRAVEHKASERFPSVAAMRSALMRCRTTT